MKKQGKTQKHKEVKAADVETKIKPLADRALIKEFEKDASGETRSGIIIPDTVSEDRGAKRGRVVAVGEGRWEEGRVVPMKVKVGDTVLFQWGDQLKIDGEDYQIVSESSILAIIK